MTHPATAVVFQRRVVWLTVFAACLVPFASLVWRFFADDLGSDPVETLIRSTGDWAIRFIIGGLMITPLRQIGWNAPARFRRMIGLYAFFYVWLHLTIYLVIDQGLDVPSIVGDILKRPYITIGMLAFVLLVPLAATSTAGMVRRLGARNWMRLHRLVYLIGVLAVIHYYLLVKADVTWPIIYGTILALGLTWRIKEKARRRRQTLRTGMIVRDRRTAPRSETELIP